MVVTGVTSAQTSSASAPAATGKKEIGKEDFLRLLVAQLKNQNPLEPLKDTEFMGQMAQFSSLDYMQEMAANMKTLSDSLNMLLNSQSAQQRELLLTQALNLVGKDVEVQMPGGTKPIQGTVTGVKMVSGRAYLLIGTEEVPISGVEQIKLTGAGSAQGGA